MMFIALVMQNTQCIEKDHLTLRIDSQEKRIEIFVL